MDKTQFQNLLVPFEDVQTKPGKGGYKYIASNDIIERMNTTFQGKWTTEIVQHDIVEDQIIVFARVSVTSADGGRLYYQDGVASHPLTRFTYGDNKGKPIDLGNSYTSAFSKAIKQACKKWGVALNIEEDEFGRSGVDGGQPTSPSSKSSAPKIPTVPVVPVVPVVDTTETVIPTIPTIPKVPVSTLPNTPTPIKEKAPVMPSVPSLPSTMVPTGPAKNPNFMGTIRDVDEGEDKISPVQKAALQGILALKTAGQPQEEIDAFYRKMATDAFAEKDIVKTSIPDIDNLDYDDAVIVVKYGNDLLRGNK